MKTRIYFLDNLRTFLMFLVVLVHAGIVYEPILEDGCIVSDPDKNSSIDLIRAYLDIFVMFIWFFISGYFVRYSVKGKMACGFLKSKFNRIMIPWIIACLMLIPAYKAIFLFSRGMPQEEWFSYFHLFQRAGGDLAFFADNPIQNWLWFLPVLFLFHVVYIALAKTNLFSLKIYLGTGVLLTFFIGVIYSLLLLATNLTGWFNSALLTFQRERLLIYFMGFLLGALCNKLKIFESNSKNSKYYIWSNVALTISLGVFTATALNFFFNLFDPGRNYFFVSEKWIDQISYYVSVQLSMLSFLHICIYIFRNSFNRTNSLMVELARNSYAVYIIHIVVMGLIALPLLNVHIPAFVKFLILTILTFVISNTIVYVYRIVVKNPFSSNRLGIVIPLAAILHGFAAHASQGNLL